MSALNFPTTGLFEGYEYTGDNGVVYIYDGVKWVGHAPNSTPGNNSIINNGYVVQVDGDGNLVIPIGAIIKDAEGTQYGGGGPALGDYTFFGPVLNVPTGEAHIKLAVWELETAPKLKRSLPKTVEVSRLLKSPYKQATAVSAHRYMVHGITPAYTDQVALL